MNIIVLGADGFCGWPTTLELLKAGHNVCMIDDLSRRAIDASLGTRSLTDISSFSKRTREAKEVYGDKVKSVQTEIDFPNPSMGKLIERFEPDAIIHFAEQRSAPYSMKNIYTRDYTVRRNITTTHSILSLMVEHCPKAHLIHLGTMGVYGYSDAFGDIPEGYLDITINSTGKEVEILYPTNPGSIYHMTKSMDQIMFQYYNKNWGLAITDLHQGIVWGTQTEETKKVSPNRFDYDGIYGTVLNRFIVQAAIGHPLTVYGTGKQTRAFIHISDTARCIRMAVESPPNNSNVRIFNQVSESRTLIDLANIVADQYGAEIRYYDNPRNELEQNDLTVKNEGLKSLGFEPITLDKSLIDDVEHIARLCSKRVNKDKILNSPRWQ